MHADRPVDPSNRAQLAQWDGAGGAFWVDRADRFDEGVAAYRPGFTLAAAISESDRVLDVGCGTGQETRDAGRAAPRGAALGVDLSSGMVELARHRAGLAGLPHVTFEQADAQVHPFPGPGFDVVISRHGAMFFGDPVAAFGHLGRALRPGGRLVLLTWQPYRHQEWLRGFRAALAGGRAVPDPSPDAPGPFGLSDPDRVRALLTAAGFADVRLDGLREPMYFGADVADALRFVAAQHAGTLDELEPDERPRARERLRADLAAHLDGGGVRYDSAAWLVRARRPGAAATR